MADQQLRSQNDQTLVRAIRRAVSNFNTIPDNDINGKLRAIMAVAALGAVGTVTNRQMSASTISYISAALS